MASFKQLARKNFKKVVKMNNPTPQPQPTDIHTSVIAHFQAYSISNLLVPGSEL